MIGSVQETVLGTVIGVAGGLVVLFVGGVGIVGAPAIVGLVLTAAVGASWGSFIGMFGGITGGVIGAGVGVVFATVPGGWLLAAAGVNVWIAKLVVPIIVVQLVHLIAPH